MRIKQLKSRQPIKEPKKYVNKRYGKILGLFLGISFIFIWVLIYNHVFILYYINKYQFFLHVIIPAIIVILLLYDGWIQRRIRNIISKVKGVKSL